MKIRKIISAILTMSVMSACIIPIAKADGLYSEKFDMTKVKADKTDGVTKEVEVPDGDYTVTVTTGGKTETNANIYINGGERVRAYTLRGRRRHRKMNSLLCRKTEKSLYRLRVTTLT